MTVALAAPPQRQHFAYAVRNASPRNELQNEAQLVHAEAVGTVVEDDSSRGSVGSAVCCRQKSSAFYFVDDGGDCGAVEQPFRV